MLLYFFFDVWFLALTTTLLNGTTSTAIDVLFTRLAQAVILSVARASHDSKNLLGETSVFLPFFILNRSLYDTDWSILWHDNG